MKIFYDFEFVEDGRTIDPISIGMVRDDGQELYLINGQVNLRKVAWSDWLMANVVPYLPLKVEMTEYVRADMKPVVRPKLAWDPDHSDYDRVTLFNGRLGIARAVRAFIGSTPKPELWAWYAAYDHIALAQLFGPMTGLPAGVPQWTNDLRQEIERIARNGGDARLPRQQSAAHHALNDARWVKHAHAYLACEGLL